MRNRFMFALILLCLYLTLVLIISMNFHQESRYPTEVKLISPLYGEYVIGEAVSEFTPNLRVKIMSEDFYVADTQADVKLEYFSSTGTDEKPQCDSKYTKTIAGTLHFYRLMVLLLSP